MRLTEHAVETAPSACRLAVARSGEEALERLEEGRDPDLVLLDLDLPDVPGHELCERMRSRIDRCRVPIVVLTSSEQADDVRASYEVGANSHVTKAVDFQAFREDLAGILAYWLDVNRVVSTS